MKTSLFILVTFLAINFANAQYATNFNCADCAGTSHDLFTELDAGKIVVFCWVMPCGSCVPVSKTTYAVVQTFATSNPDKVVMYLCDDDALTSCTSLSGWANTNKLYNAKVFSNATIDMLDYGAYGMPKVTVVGTKNHKVYFTAENTINGTALQTAINTAIAETTTSGINEIENKSFDANLTSNLSNSVSNLNINLIKNSKIKIEIYNQIGQKVLEVYNGKLNEGENNLEINTSELSAGLYFININDSESSKIIKLIVSK